MSEHSIVLLGGPDSGKTNYMSRLWLALNSKKAELVASQNPTDIRYVEGGAEHILGGAFAPRSDTNSLPDDLTLDIPVRLASDPDGKEVLLSVPDVSGELWKEAIERGDVRREWMEALQQASGALLVDFRRELTRDWAVFPLRSGSDSHLLLLRATLLLIHWRISGCIIDFSARASRRTGS